MSKALPSVPSFSKQQVHDLINIIHSVMQQYFASSNQPSSNQITSASIPAPHDQPPSTPPAPQEAQKEQDIQLLQQITVKNTTESTTKPDSSVPDSKSTLSTIPPLCTAHSATCPSNTLLLACLLGHTLLDYIKYSAEIEKTEQE